MKKNLLLVLFIGLLFGDHSLVCLKRKRLDGDGRQVKRRKVAKRRKRGSKYDKYKGDDGKYYCPDCADYSANNSGTFLSHLSKRKHGPYKTKEVKKRGSIYDRYKGEDRKYHCPDCDNYSANNLGTFRFHLRGKRHGLYKIKEIKSIYDKYKDDDEEYYCPDCDYYSTNTLSTFLGHLKWKRHGPYKTKEVKKRGSIYDKYKGDDGRYHCPDCDNYSAENLFTFRAHIISKKHGHRREEIETLADDQDELPFVVIPEELVSIKIEGEYSMTVLPSLSQEENSFDSILYALWNAVCLMFDDEELLYDNELLEEYMGVVKTYAHEHDIDLAIIDIDEMKKLIRDLDLLIVLREEDGELAQNVSIVDDVDGLSPEVLRRIRQFKKDGETQIFIVHTGGGYWVTMKFSRQDDKDQIEITDSAYVDSSLGMLVGVVEKLLGVLDNFN